jgi:N-acetylmuramoyl-L-alanine amidase
VQSLLGGDVPDQEYVIKEGDCLINISHQNGLFWETVWADPGNAGLKDRRKDPFTLMEGDVLHVPAIRPRIEQGATDMMHRFQLKSTPAKLKLRLLDIQDEPRKGLTYWITINGAELPGGPFQTDGDGGIEHWIPPDAKQGKLIVTAGSEEYDLQLGHLDPMTEISGLQARLANLGFYQGPIDGKMSEEVSDVIYDFQLANDLVPTGEIDDDVKNLLFERHVA